MATFSVASFAGNASGNNRGQSFTPNVAGPDGSGSPGSASTVYLQTVSIGYPTSDTTNRQTVIYVYDTLPTLVDLNNNGSGSIYKSISYADDTGTFGANTYSRIFSFANYSIDPTKTYYLLFAANQVLRFKTGNPYSGGSLYSTLLAAVANDAQFKVVMADTI